MSLGQLKWEENEVKYPHAGLAKIPSHLDQLAKISQKVAIPSQLNPTEPESSKMDLAGLTFEKADYDRWVVFVSRLNWKQIWTNALS